MPTQITDVPSIPDRRGVGWWFCTACMVGQTLTPDENAWLPWNARLAIHNAAHRHTRRPHSEADSTYCIPKED